MRVPPAHRTYRLTVAGAKALVSQRSVPAWYRSILSLMDGDTAASAILGVMTADPPKKVLAWIDELETLCFIALASERPEAANSEPEATLPLEHQEAA